MGSARYTAVVLDDASVNALRAHFKAFMDTKLSPTGFVYRTAQGEPLPHHMTMNMGPCQTPLLLGADITLRVTGWGMTEKAFAVQVQSSPPVPVQSGNPHVTMGINPGEGGKPKDSGAIKSWQAMTGAPIILRGKVEEVR